MSMMLIDQTKDSACKTAEADAIRAKTGGSAQIAYDWENNKGFADAIDAIPSGGTPTRTNKYRPPDWPDYDSLQNLPNTGMVFFTFDTQICDPADLICNICWYDGSSGLTYYRVQVDRGYIANGQFVATQSWTNLYYAVQSVGAAHDDIDRSIPTNEGRYVVYRVWTPEATGQTTNIGVFLANYTDADGNLRDRFFAPVVEVFAWKAGKTSQPLSPFDSLATVYMYMHTFRHCLISSGTSMYWNFTWRFPKYVEIDDLKNSTFSWYYPFNTSAIEAVILKNFTMTNTNSVGQLFGKSSRLNALVLDHMTVTTGSLTGCFQDCLALRSLDVAGWNVGTVADAKNCFNGCSSLIDLNISDWDLSAVTNATDMFKNMNKLKNVTCTRTKLPSQNLSFAQSERLTDASLVNIANALPVSNKTLTLHATPKGRLSTIMGTISSGVFTADAGGSDTLQDFITTTKGWTIA